jgi:dUTP pyrophosphatase
MQVKRNFSDAQLPTRGTPGAAGFDLYCHSIKLSENGLVATIDTGISTAFSPDKVLLVFSRSGQGVKHATRLANCVGVIDSDYRGPLLITLCVDGSKGIDYLRGIQPGDRIAQMLLVQLGALEQLEEVTELDETVRGNGGHGSTGR